MKIEAMEKKIMKAVLKKKEGFRPFQSAMAEKKKVPTIRPTAPRVNKSVARVILEQTQSLSVTAVVNISLSQKRRDFQI